jgi:diaminopimelate epimerase
MNGAGNDFILFDRKINPDFELTTAIISELCDRHAGIGADGVLLISDSVSHAFEMMYFNSDGSTGSLCANGARCAIKYGFISGRYGTEKIKFTANREEYTGNVLEKGDVRFFLNHPKKMKHNFKVKAWNQLIPVSFADTGSPHIIIKIEEVLIDPARPGSFFDDLNDFPVYQLGKEIRYHQDFAPAGTNVNFIKLREGKIHIRSYERGVENETLACGTGSVAAALVSFVKDALNPPISVYPKSGDELIVDFKVEEMKVKDISLTGPAKLVFKGELTI